MLYFGIINHYIYLANGFQKEPFGGHNLAWHHYPNLVQGHIFLRPTKKTQKKARSFLSEFIEINAKKYFDVVGLLYWQQCNLVPFSLKFVLPSKCRYIADNDTKYNAHS